MEQLCLSNDFNLENKQLIRVLCMHLSEHITFCFFVLYLYSILWGDLDQKEPRSGITVLLMTVQKSSFILYYHYYCCCCCFCWVCCYLESKLSDWFEHLRYCDPNVHLKSTHLSCISLHILQMLKSIFLGEWNCSICGHVGSNTLIHMSTQLFCLMLSEN